MGARETSAIWLAIVAMAPLGAGPVTAATRYVDAGCPASGTGASLACGAAGPFRTIQEGVNAMAAGDTILVRGGQYEERVVIARPCSATARCTIAAYGDEQPAVRGMLRRTDWTAAGGAVWWRAMEATPDEPTNQQPNDYHPMTVYQEGGAGPLTPLGYDGDDVATPRDGHWSYHPGSRRLYVNPVGDAGAAATIHVPHVSILVQLDSPAAHVTLRGFRLEGARGILIEAVNTGYPLEGIVVEGNQLRYFPRFGIRFNGAPGLVLRNNVIEYGGRGLGGYLGGSYGAYGMRLFAVHDAVIEGNSIAHLGHGGCPWCDPPWNDNDHSRLGENVYANALDYKQTLGGRIADNTIVDVADRGIGLDVSREVTVTGNLVERVRTALSSRTQTPETTFTACAENVFSDNVVDGCEIGVRIEDDPYPGAEFLARIERTTITRTTTPYDVPSRPYVTVDGTTPPTTGSSTTTTSNPRSTTTSTSLPFDRLVGGDKLLLQDRPGRPEARRFVLRSRDAARLVVGNGDDVEAVVAGGGTLRVVAEGGDGFTAVYPLAPAGWRAMSVRNPRAGMRYRAHAGPVTSIVFRSRRALRIAGHGALLEQSLGAEPSVVRVELRLGPYRYCFEFGGGLQRFSPGTMLLRKAALRPLACE